MEVDIKTDCSTTISLLKSWLSEVTLAPIDEVGWIYGNSCHDK